MSHKPKNPSAYLAEVRKKYPLPRRPRKPHRPARRDTFPPSVNHGPRYQVQWYTVRGAPGRGTPSTTFPDDLKAPVLASGEVWYRSDG